MAIGSIQRTTPVSFIKQRPILCSFTISMIALAIIGALGLANVGALKDLSMAGKISMLTIGACISGISISIARFIYGFQVMDEERVEEINQEILAWQRRQAQPAAPVVPVMLPTPVPPVPSPSPAPAPSPPITPQPMPDDGNMPAPLLEPLSKAAISSPSAVRIVVIPDAHTPPPPKVTPIIHKPSASPVCTPIIQKPITSDTDYDDLSEGSSSRTVSIFGHLLMGCDIGTQYTYSIIPQFSQTPTKLPLGPYHVKWMLSHTVDFLFEYFKKDALEIHDDAIVTSIFYRNDTIGGCLNCYKDVFPPPTLGDLNITDGTISVEIYIPSIASLQKHPSSPQVSVTTHDAPKVS